MKIMNSRQRLLTVLNCQQPDRVPISTFDLVGYNTKAWENNDPSYKKLMDFIREKTDCVCIWDPVPQVRFQTRDFELPMLGSFMETGSLIAVDIDKYREGNSEITHITAHTPKGDVKTTYRVMDNVVTSWQTEHWCKNLDDVDKALSIPYEPIKYDFSDYARIKEEVGDKGIIMSMIPDPLCLTAELMEFGEFTIWAMTETDHFARTVAILHERFLQNLKNMLDVQLVDLYWICGPEYATPPYLPPRFFRQFVVPYVKDITQLIHSRGSKVRIHIHGKIKRVLDMILETGVDAIDPCESPPDGDVPLDEIKNQIGDQICIFGNLQPKILEHASVDEVERTVIECMQAAKAGGGYVIMPTSMPIHTPLDKKTEGNYIRFIETALEYGNY